MTSATGPPPPRLKRRSGGANGIRKMDRAISTADLASVKRPRWMPAALAAAAIVLLLPFAGKAVHIDDPLFIWSAKQIVAHPFDPYGFSVNWYGVTRAMHEVTKNPPGAAYYMALAGAAAGWSETALHLAFFLPA